MAEGLENPGALALFCELVKKPVAKLCFSSCKINAVTVRRPQTGYSLQVKHPLLAQLTYAGRKR